MGVSSLDFGRSQGRPFVSEDAAAVRLSAPKRWATTECRPHIAISSTLLYNITVASLLKEAKDAVDQHTGLRNPLNPHRQMF